RLKDRAAWERFPPPVRARLGISGLPSLLLSKHCLPLRVGLPLARVVATSTKIESGAKRSGTPKSGKPAKSEKSEVGVAATVSAVGGIWTSTTGTMIDF